jgi:tetratricopeptide (TPR) repeat protein
MNIRRIVLLLVISLSCGWGSAEAAVWEEFLDRADSLLTAGRLYEANRAVEMAISEGLVEFGESDTTSEFQLYRYGNAKTYYFRKHSEAESLYSRALSVKAGLLEAETPGLGEIIFNLAELKRLKKKFAEAQALYERALLIGQATLGSEHPYLGRLLRGLADAFTGLKDYERAQTLYKQSLDILKQAPDLEYPDLAFALRVTCPPIVIPLSYTVFQALEPVEEPRFFPSSPPRTTSREPAAGTRVHCAA